MWKWLRRARPTADPGPAAAAWRVNPATRLMDAVAVELIQDGFRLVPGGPTVPWATVNRVTTYKLDFLISDMICLDFDLDGSPAAVVTHEQMPGWADLAAALSARLEGVADGWYGTVLRPAFATNARVIWTRPAGEQ